MSPAFQNTHRDKLTPNERQLLDQATIARKLARAPYSEFLVGAALEFKNGVVVTGANFETANYDGSCAERVAIFRANMEKTLSQDNPLVRLAVIGGHREDGSEKPTTPCGRCRQTIREIISKEQPIEVIMAATNGRILKTLFRNLLPASFGPDDL
jgi:cytidine deaminase